MSIFDLGIKKFNFFSSYIKSKKPQIMNGSQVPTGAKTAIGTIVNIKNLYAYSLIFSFFNITFLQKVRTA